MSTSTPIASQILSEPSGLLKWFRKGTNLKDHLGKPATETYLCRGFADRSDEVKRILPKQKVGRLGPDDLVAQVSTGPFEAEISFAGLVGKDGVDFDVTVSTTWRIADARAFLNDRGLNWLKSTESVGVVRVENLLADCCKQPVTDEMRTITYESMKKQDALPVTWWRDKLRSWCSLNWLGLVEINDVSYESATADKAVEIQRRQELQELEAAERQQQQEAEVRLRAQRAEFENAKRQIEAEKELSEQERQARLEEARLEHEKKALKLREEMQTIKLEGQRKRAELEAEIARQRHRADEAEEIRRQAEEAEERSKELLADIRQAQDETAEIHKVIGDAIKQGMAGAERMAASAVQVSPTTLGLLGRASGPGYLAHVLQTKASGSAPGIIMKKVELLTRDIGTKKVDSLAINSSLQFEFMSRRAGYATVLNIGTSGAVWLQIPNAYVDVDEAQVAAGQKYTVPGSLLPADELSRNNLAYLEVGPPGWEELVVVVSNEPLVTAADVFESTPDSPFVQLSDERVEELLDQLASMSDQSWGAGMLAFVVE